MKVANREEYETLKLIICLVSFRKKETTYHEEDS